MNYADPQVRAEFTDTGLRRLMCIEDGPCFAIAARLVLEPDGREVDVAHVPDAEPASQGRTRFILPAPPGGGYLREALMLAGDGTAIIRVTSTPPLWLPGGATLLVPVEMS
jgi:hypothetical protein